MLSSRGQANSEQPDIPWRFAKSTTYDPDTNPNGLIAFSASENKLVRNLLDDFVKRVTIPSDVFTYAYCDNGGTLPSALATHITTYFSPHRPVTPDHICVTAAATATHDILAHTLAAPGEAFLTSAPYYGRLDIDFSDKAGVKLVVAQTRHEECFSEDVVGKFEEARRKSEEDGFKVRAVVIVNPHNPLGRCYPRATLLALMRFCAEHDLHLISDEVYALSVFDNTKAPDAPRFTSLLAVDPAGIINPALVHTTYALSKDFGAAGLMVGAIITRNEKLKRAVDTVVRFHGVSGPSIALGTALLTDREWVAGFVKQSRENLADACRFATGRLEDMGVEYFEGGNAGFFLWVDLSPFLPPESEGVSVQQREFILAERSVEGELLWTARGSL